MSCALIARKGMLSSSGRWSRMIHLSTFVLFQATFASCFIGNLRHFKGALLKAFDRSSKLQTQWHMSDMSAKRKREWEDPAVLGRNKEEAHAAFFAFESRHAAIIGIRDKSRRFLSLNGHWKFHWMPHQDASTVVEEKFAEEGFNDESWGSIGVPGNWELQGYGFPMYTNIEYLFKHDPPYISYKGEDPGKDYNPVGFYRKLVDVPSAWMKPNCSVRGSEGGNSDGNDHCSYIRALEDDNDRDDYGDDYGDDEDGDDEDGDDEDGDDEDGDGDDEDGDGDDEDGDDDDHGRL
eukprot:768743-Hanusia_phi.AAC.1